MIPQITSAKNYSTPYSARKTSTKRTARTVRFRLHDEATRNRGPGFWGKAAKSTCGWTRRSGRMPSVEQL